jgi:surfeit locus 1 family protein
LDNRQMNGKPGFFVMTPLKMEGIDRVLLVQRGWVPRNFSERSALPQVDSPAGLVTVQGRIAPPPARLYEFAGAPAGPIRQNLDLVQFAAELHRPLLDVTVVQIGGPSEGLLRQWSEPATGVEKHQGYAFQWFGLAGLITILYVWFQIVRRFLLRSRPS